MRARVKRRQRNRRLAWIAAAVVLIAIFVVSAYILSQPSALDAFDNKPVSPSDMAGLSAVSALPYGTSGAVLDHLIQNASATLTSQGKPIVLFVGELGCPYCAELRWSLVLALMRFGNFTNLSYMTSEFDGTDYPTFTFIGNTYTTYTSKYIVLQTYEVEDRAGNALQTLPSNYKSIFDSLSVNGGVPFVDFGGRYYTPSALLPSSIPGYSDYISYLSALFGSQNWAQVISGISSGSTLGTLIKGGANVITAAICKSIAADGGAPPSSICQQSPINQLGPVSMTLPALSQPPTPPVVALQDSRRLGW